MSGGVQEWRDAYAVHHEIAVSQHGWCACFLCPRCTANYLAVEADSIALDLAVAEQIAGRTPTWVIPTWMVTQEDVAW